MEVQELYGKRAAMPDYRDYAWGETHRGKSIQTNAEYIRVMSRQSIEFSKAIIDWLHGA